MDDDAQQHGRSDDQPALIEAPARLALVEVLDRDGHARLAVPVTRWPVRVGRAIENDVVLDDVHVAAHHATLDQGAGGLWLQVDQSINGAQLGGRRRVAAGERAQLPASGVFLLGGTRLRVRRAGETLAPEKPLAPEPRGGWVPLAVMLLLLMAWSVAEQWLNTDPGGRLIDYLPVAVGGPVALALWCGLWALGSKLFQHRFAFWPHARIAVSYLLASGVVGLVLPLVAYVLSWEFASRVSGIATGAVLCAMVVAHLSQILPARRRLLSVAMSAAFVAGVAVLLLRNYQINDRVFDELYVTTLAPPALRLAGTVDAQRFIDDAADLKATLDKHARDDSEADAGEPEDEDE